MIKVRSLFRENFVEVSSFLLLIDTFFDVCPKLSSLNDNELI